MKQLLYSPKSRFINIVGREIHYTQWGNPDHPVLFMLHGFARNCHDFDHLADFLSKEFFVICPDMPGRGLSSWEEHTRNYALPIYNVIMMGLIQKIGCKYLSWLGTSMGGLLGISLAASFLNKRITHMIINDVGPFIPLDIVKSIAKGAKTISIFNHFREFRSHLKTHYAPFGQLDEHEWTKFAAHSVRRTKLGGYKANYDVGISDNFDGYNKDLNMWSVYKQVESKILLIHGQNSDLLPNDLVKKMIECHPHTQLHEVKDAGHAPYLNGQKEIERIRTFLLEKTEEK